MKSLLRKFHFNQFCIIISGLPYKASIAEDTPVESTLFQAIEVTDADLVGDVLDVQCVHRPGFEEGVCDSFEIQPRRLETDHDMFRGSVILKKPLDYRLVCVLGYPGVSNKHGLTLISFEKFPSGYAPFWRGYAY